LILFNKIKILRIKLYRLKPWYDKLKEIKKYIDIKNKTPSNIYIKIRIIKY